METALSRWQRMQTQLSVKLKAVNRSEEAERSLADGFATLFLQKTSLLPEYFQQSLQN